MKKKTVRILCVCTDDCERAPAMAAVLGMYLQNRYRITYICESAGIDELANTSGPASTYASKATAIIGQSLHRHSRRHISSLRLGDYKLIVVADANVARDLVQRGLDEFKIYNADIPDAWPANSSNAYRHTFVRILGSMFDIAEYLTATS